MEIINYLNSVIQKNRLTIDDFFKFKLQNLVPTLYNSVDIRDSGFKVAPVDTNIFPAGFNNLSDQEIKKTNQEFKNYISTYYPNTKNILLITENHTRNLFYLDNVYALTKVFEGFELQISNLLFEKEEILISNSSHELKYTPIKLKDNFLVDKNDNKFDLVILNNDLSSGYNELIKNANNPIIPNPLHGWFNRSKVKHFEAYYNLVEELSKLININPFFITTQVKACGYVNFKEKTGLECLTSKAEELLQNLKIQYKEMKIPYDPYLFIKADQGTYGMGIMSITSAEEILNLNKDTRKKMAVIKEGMENTSVIIQEGIPTQNKYNNNPAEPMSYLIGGKPISLFLRVNSEQDETGNLNSKGMFFINDKFNKDEISVYSLISQLASLATIFEI
ncbi:MAG: glutamate--cysteine ligase [Sphingobacteriia bacterium]|nr:glutamate--cysteine ligase [Sphingobacteriia bacterium]